MRVRPIPLLFLLVGVTAWLGYWASYVSTPLPVSVAVHRRVLFDVIGVLVDRLISVSGLDFCCSSVLRWYGGRGKRAYADKNL